MVIAGVIVLALAAVAAGVAWWQHREQEELAAVETSTCGEMRQLADAVSVSAGGGAFRQRCELTGVAKPAYVGTVNSPLTGREAVWYRARVTHEYYDYEYDHDDRGGQRRRVKKSRVLQDDNSDIPFAVDDGTGQAVVHPDTADVDEPVQVLDEMEREVRETGLLEMIKSSAVGADETIGYRARGVDHPGRPAAVRPGRGHRRGGPSAAAPAREGVVPRVDAIRGGAGAERRLVAQVERRGGRRARAGRTGAAGARVGGVAGGLARSAGRAA